MDNQQPRLHSRNSSMEFMNKDEFRPSKMYPPLAANQNGDIKNLKTGNIRKVATSNSGYHFIANRFGIFYVHRIVADAFIPNPDNLPWVNHKNGIKTDNRVENLEWCTRSQNAKHAHSLGLLSSNGKCGEESNLSVYTEEKIIAICDDLQNGMRNVDAAKKHSVSASYIKDIKAQRTWKHITSKYTFEKKAYLLSESTVRWICNKIKEGKQNKEIFELSGGKIPKYTIKAIKSSKAYRHISKDYF